jgi:hypothetical protein
MRDRIPSRFCISLIPFSERIINGLRDDERTERGTTRDDSPSPGRCLAQCLSESHGRVARFRQNRPLSLCISNEVPGAHHLNSSGQRRPPEPRQFRMMPQIRVESLRGGNPVWIGTVVAWKKSVTITILVQYFGGIRETTSPGANTYSEGYPYQNQNSSNPQAWRVMMP